MTIRALALIVCLLGASVASAQIGRPGLGQRNPQGRSFRRPGPDTPPLLLLAIRSQRNLRYTGTYTAEFRQGGDSKRHQEFITRDGAWYRIDFPTDSQFAGQVIVENATMRLHYRPIPNEIMQQPPRHGEAWEKVANLVNNKKFIVRPANGETIAGIRTEQLVVTDQAGNVAQRLFIDPVSGVILKRQIFDLVGTEIGFFQFDKISLNPRIDPSAFEIKRKDAKIVTPLLQLERISKRRGFAVQFLPPSSGFQLEGTVYKNFAGVDGLVETYVDGRIRLWIYVLKSPLDPQKLRNNASPNQHIYTFDASGETIVMLGNVDERAMARYATMMSSGTLPRRH